MNNYDYRPWTDLILTILLIVLISIPLSLTMHNKIDLHLCLLMHSLVHSVSPVMMRLCRSMQLFVETKCTVFIIHNRVRINYYYNINLKSTMGCLPTK